jgi:hypothetical protein
VVQAGLDKTQDPVSRTARAKRARGVAQGGEYPKHEALSSKPSTTEKKYLYKCYIPIYTQTQK